MPSGNGASASRWMAACGWLGTIVLSAVRPTLSLDINAALARARIGRTPDYDP